MNCVSKRFFLYKSYKIVLLFILISITSEGMAQQKVLRNIEAVYDTAGLPELMNTIQVGFIFRYEDHTSQSTQGFLKGNIPWKRVEVTTSQGTFHQGRLTFDRKKVWRNAHQVAFHVKTNGETYVCNLGLPFVERIRFNLYTDSLKRAEAFYLNVEGKFSNGRTYPLDTNMISFSKSGGGRLSGQSLLVESQDTGIRSVMVYTRLNADPQIRDSVLVPVKILPDPAFLPAREQKLRRK